METAGTYVPFVHVPLPYIYVGGAAVDIQALLYTALSDNSIALDLYKNEL
jgi:hypothetical protein